MKRRAELAKPLNQKMLLKYINLKGFSNKYYTILYTYKPSCVTRMS